MCTGNDFRSHFQNEEYLLWKPVGSFRYQTQNQVAASAFLSTSQYLHHALELCSADLYCNGRAFFTPSLITTLDFILKMFSVCAPVSQILFQNSSKDCNPCRSPYKSYDWISWQHPLRCCWLIFVLLKVRKFAQIRKPSLLLNNQPNFYILTLQWKIWLLWAEGIWPCYQRHYARLNEVSFSSDYSALCIIHIVF